MYETSLLLSIGQICGGPRYLHILHTSSMYGAEANIFFEPDDLSVKPNDRARLTSSEAWTAIVNIFLVDNNRFSARFHDEASSSARSS